MFIVSYLAGLIPKSPEEIAIGNIKKNDDFQKDDTKNRDYHIIVGDPESSDNDESKTNSNSDYSYDSEDSTDSEDYFNGSKIKKMLKQDSCFHLRHLSLITVFFEKNKKTIIKSYLQNEPPNWIKSYLKLKLNLESKDIRLFSYFIPMTHFVHDDICLVEQNSFIVKESLYNAIKYNFTILAINTTKKLINYMEKKQYTNTINNQKRLCSCESIDNYLSCERQSQKEECVFLTTFESDKLIHLREFSIKVPNEFVYLLCGSYFTDKMKEMSLKPTNWYIVKLSLNETVIFKGLFNNNEL